MKERICRCRVNFACLCSGIPA